MLLLTQNFTGRRAHKDRRYVTTLSRKGVPCGRSRYEIKTVQFVPDQPCRVVYLEAYYGGDEEASKVFKRNVKAQSAKWNKAGNCVNHANT